MSHHGDYHAMATTLRRAQVRANDLLERARTSERMLDTARERLSEIQALMKSHSIGYTEIQRRTAALILELGA